MRKKITVVVLSLIAALGTSAAGAAGARKASPLRACIPEVSACYPIGNRPVNADPRAERTRPTIQPATDSRGRSVWRSGRYLME